jgi:hypothetical protein
MADYLPQATGSWTTTTWITAFGGLSAFAGGNTPPTVIDDVYADGKTIYVNIDTHVRTILNTTTPRNGGLAGGFFVLNDTVTLSANVIGGGTNQIACVQFLSAAPATATLVGNLCATNIAISGPRALLHNGTGTFTVIGNGLGRIKGSGNPGDGYIQNQSTGTLNLFGNYIVGTTAIVDNRGIWNQVGGTINLVGNLSGGIGSGEGIYNASTGTVNITGNVFGGLGGVGLATGASNNSTGTINVLGNLIGTNTFGGANISTGTFNVTGNCIGGALANANGIQNGSTGLVTVVGNVSGGLTSTSYGANNNSTGRLFVNGSAIASNFGAGANNASTGFLYITRAVGNNFGLGTVGINSIVGAQNTQNGLMYVEQFEFGPRGQTPISGPVYILPSNRNTLTGYTTAVGTPVTYYNTLSVTGLLPPVSSVQAGVVYNVGNSVGTMAVPSASAVQSGVPVDNTIGTAALQPQDVWGYARLSATQVNSMGDRLRNAATTQSIGSQIASFNL